VALLFERAAVLLLQYYQHEIGGARLGGGATRALTGMRAQSGGVHYLSPLRGKVGTQKRWKVEGALGGADVSWVEGTRIESRSRCAMNKGPELTVSGGVCVVCSCAWW
jgi:hypothetical protein